ncbi:hypothetical protein QD47_18110 [Paenibacillus terrae]|uniref:Uncharacterized protein n=1 Tax=Paenibacillus terrae TaxID=159743 RepID=A0A0D7WZV5_9BACL|nr:hypothetical protein QD47_18110 [Paenibacillus terrae]
MISGLSPKGEGVTWRLITPLLPVYALISGVWNLYAVILAAKEWIGSATGRVSKYRIPKQSLYHDVVAEDRRIHRTRAALKSEAWYEVILSARVKVPCSHRNQLQQI